jgi:hypothetical protein
MALAGHPPRTPPLLASTIMKTKHQCALVAMCCAVAALAGCASTDRQISRSSLDEKNQERDKAHPPMGLSQPVLPDGRAFEKVDLETNGAITLDNRQRFDTNVEAKENFSTADENNLQINSTELLIPAPKFSHPYSVFGGSDQTNNNDFSWDEQEFQPQGLLLFTFHF